MRVVALLSWFDEKPDHLRRVIRSLRGFADHLVAVDGRYVLYPDERYLSPVEQYDAILTMADVETIGLTLHEPAGPWLGGEVEKRAAMFRLGLALTAPEDWFLIIDGDMEVAQYDPEAREHLEDSPYDVAEVLWRDVRPSDGAFTHITHFRSLFRALPGLTVERTHWLYMVGDRYLWHTPDGHIAPEPAQDLSEMVTLHHHNAQRAPERKQAALDYYKARDEQRIERPT